MLDQISRILRGLRSSNAKRQERAYKKIWDLDITPENGVRLIEAAAETFPNGGLVEGYQRINRDLIRFLWNEPHEEFVDAIERVYDRLADKEEAREQALRLLAEIESENSLRALVRLLKRPSSQSVDISFTFVPLVGSLFVPNQEPLPAGVAMFPELFDLLDREAFQEELYRVITSYARAGRIALSDDPEFVSRCLSQSRQAIAQLAAALQQTSLSRTENEQAMRSAEQLEMLLKLLKFVDSPETEDVFRQTVELDFPSLQIEAATGLIARDQTVEPAFFEEFVQVPHRRARLWDALRKIDRLDVFPESYRNQPALAEAEMVKWLTFLTEMGRPPEQIELLKVHEHDDPDMGRVQNFFFKFRHAHFDDGKWFVGVAGPYAVNAPPTMHADGTFSQFEELEKRDLDSHIRAYLEGEHDAGPFDVTVPVDDA